MAGAIMNKVWDLFGMDTQEEKEESVYDMDEEYTNDEEVEEKRLWGKQRVNSKVVSLPQPQQIKMVISQPTSFEQSESICDLLKEKKISYSKLRICK